MIREGAQLFEGLPDDIDFDEAVLIKAKQGNPVAKNWLRKLAEEEEQNVEHTEVGPA